MFGKVFLHHGGFGQLVVGKFLTAGSHILLGGFLALLDQLLDHFEDVPVGDFLAASFGGLEKKNLAFDGADGVHCHRILGLHGLLDSFLDGLFECHIECR